MKCCFAAQVGCHSGTSTMSREERTFREWLAAYVETYKQPPKNAEQLCAYARNHGGHVMFRLVKEKLNQAFSEAPSLHRSSSSPARMAAPVLLRFRSDKAEKVANIVSDWAQAMPSMMEPSTHKQLVAVKFPKALSNRKLAAAVLAISYRRIAEREAAKSRKVTDFGLNGSYSMETKTETSRCAICLELAPGTLQSAGELCKERSCDKWFCRPCIQTHVTTIIADTRFSVPTIRCPGCFGFIPPSIWQSFVESDLLSTWKDNAADVLSIRCGDCDEPGTLLQTESRHKDDITGRKVLADTAFPELQDCSSLVEKWFLFEKGSMGANDLVVTLLELWGFPEEDEEKTPEELTKKLDASLQLVEDSGLRATLQLAILKRYPKIRTTCCDADHCFRCKIHTHHEGSSCEEILKEQLPEGDIQFCPSCGVATVRTEGCNHIICLCGENWTWEGDED
eukprot:Skav216554  [mRNA]  locus=scaffold1776:371671:373026:- [translate_table: standard]